MRESHGSNEAQAFHDGLVSVAALIMLALWIATGCAPEMEKPPNVLFIAVDDLNDWTSTLGGHPQARTPHIDALASRGVVFTNAHAPAPTCGPSRAAIMTGIRPSTSGNYENRDTFVGNPVLNGSVTLPEFFGRAGYGVIGAGKLYHGRHHKSELQGRGFDVYWPSKRNDHYKEPSERARPKPMSDWGQGAKTFWDWGPMAPQITFDDMSDGRMANWIHDQLASGELEEPFFVGAGIIRPHLPFYAPQSYFDMYPLDEIELPEVKEDDLADVPRAGRLMGIGEAQHARITAAGHWKTAVQAYLATTSYADDCVGRVLEGLEKSGLASNTIVVLWSDHGFQFGEKKHWSKFTLWERSTRVNLVIAGPGIVGGRRTNAPVNLLDLYPTLASLIGAEAPAGQLEGRDLSPLLRGSEVAWPHTSVTTYGAGNHSVRDERYRYIRYADGGEELYDHEVDPNEWTNLATSVEHRAISERLAAALPARDAARIRGVAAPTVRALD